MSRKTYRIISYASIFLIIIVVFTENISLIANGMMHNLTHVLLAQVWLNRKISQISGTSSLKDRIPDDWTVSSWDNSTQEFSMDSNEAYEGNYSFRIHKTNPIGAASIYQIVPFESALNYKISLRSKGDGGQIIVTPIDSNNELAQNETIRLIFPQSNDWEGYEWVVKFQKPFPKAQIWLAVYRPGAITWLDQISFRSTDQTNLLKDPGFEHDGNTKFSLPSVDNPKITILSELINRNHSNDEIWHRDKAQLIYLQGYEESYLEDLDWIISKNIADPIRHTGWVIGEINNQIAAGNNGLAQYICDSYLSIDPLNPQIKELLGDALSKTGAYRLAVEAYHSALSDSNPRIAYKLGLLYLNKIGDYKKADKYLKLAQHDDQIAHDIENKMVGQLALGTLMINNGNYIEAEKILNLIVSLTPTSSEVNQKAEIYLSQIRINP